MIDNSIKIKEKQFDMTINFVMIILMKNIVIYVLKWFKNLEES